MTSGVRLRLAVLAGGAAGTALRAGLTTATPQAAGTFPWATFLVNVAGAGALGFVVVHLRRRRCSPVVAAALATGVLGALTTFSTFAAEITALLARAPVTAAAYAAASITAGLLAAAAGAGLARGRRPGGDEAPRP